MHWWKITSPPDNTNKASRGVRNVCECHEKSAYLGQEYVLSILRQKYWIFGIRKIIKSVWKNCRKCRLEFFAPLSQKIANLPQERVIADKPLFNITSVDYLGLCWWRSGVVKWKDMVVCLPVYDKSHPPRSCRITRNTCFLECIPAFHCLLRQTGSNVVR